MNFSGARIVVECLKAERVKVVFAYPGGAVIPIFDELYKHGEKIKVVQPKHEQGGAHAADGYGRVTGKPGVCIVTSGPGATNTVTGIATAYCDSTPMVVISGQVSTSLIGSDAFQEVDISGMVATITKASFLVTDINDLSGTLKKAFYLAKSGRPGPVLVDIPVDIQKQTGEFRYPEKILVQGYHPYAQADIKQLKKAVQVINSAKKPLVIAGGGINLSGSNYLLNKFLDKFCIPVVCTLQGHGLNPKNEKLFLGGFGMHGTVAGNYAVQNADLILVLGARFSDRVTGIKQSFAKNAKIIHVDVDISEKDKNICADVSVSGNVNFVLKKLVKMIAPKHEFYSWVEKLDNLKNLSQNNTEENSLLTAKYLFGVLNNYINEDTVLVGDVGQHQMWIAQYCRFKAARSFFSSGGLGTMGFALPAALGVKLGKKKKNVIVVVGDGGFPMNMQELLMAVRYGLNVKVLIVDNSGLGMVRQWQHMFYGKRYSETVFNKKNDYVSLVKAMGINAKWLTKKEDANSVIEELVTTKKIMVVQAVIDSKEAVLPMVPTGKPLDKQIEYLED